MSNILIIQTCDGVVYKPLLDLSQEINNKYAIKHGYGYFRYDGVKKPFNKDPSLSTFNRIYLLLDTLNEDKYEWVLYLDADAIVYDINKNLDEFIIHKNKAIVACRGGTDNPANFWDINIGVCLYNLKHPKMPYILENWKNMFEFYGKNISNTVDNWEKSQQKLDDQNMLHIILKKDNTLCHVYYGEENEKMNYNGPFIKQLIRGNKTTFESRLNDMKNLCNIINRKF